MENSAGSQSSLAGKKNEAVNRRRSDAKVSDSKTGSAGKRKALVMEPHFCPKSARDPFETVQWATRTATIKGDNGSVFWDNLEKLLVWDKVRE